MVGNSSLFVVVTLLFVFLEKSKTFGQPRLYNNYIFLLMIPVFLCLVSVFSSECSKYLHIRKKKQCFVYRRKEENSLFKDAVNILFTVIWCQTYGNGPLR